MARYEVKLRNSGTYGIFTDGKGFVDIEEVCDLLNAHDGMMTRADIERLGDIDRRLSVNSQYQEGLRDGYNHAIRDVLNGGAK